MSQRRGRGVPYSGVQLRRDLRQVRLQELGYRNYPAYLRSPHWFDLRREYQASGLPQDCFCGETKGIQLHHTTYERVGREKLTDLTPVCPTCHAMIHALEARGEIGLDFTGFVNEQRAEQRRAEVERAEHEREMARAYLLAEWEDLIRMVENMRPLAKRLATSAERSSAQHHISRIVSPMHKAERRLELLL